MSVTQFLTIILIVLFNKTIYLSAENLDVWREKTILKKCCPLGEYVQRITRTKTCSKYSSDNLNLSDLKIYNKDLDLTSKPLKDIFKLDPGIFVRDINFKMISLDPTKLKLNTYLTEMGTLYLEAPNEVKRWRMVNNSDFCVDYLLYKDKNTQEVTPTLRFWAILADDDERASVLDPFYITVGMLTSCVFLALVLVVYSLLPELRNLSGMVLMAYVASLFTAFLTLAVLQLGPNRPLTCLILSYFFYFSILASFCWMNVMSFDIWWTFRGFAKARPIHRFGELYKFKVYCAYGFGVPLAMTVFFITVDRVPMTHLPWFITPNLLRRSCFLEGGEKLRYLYIPMLILILMNWAFFLMTSFEIWSLHRQTAILDTASAGMRAAHRQHRTRLLIYLKLSIIMGINWVLEVVSSFSPNEPIWILFDMYNFLIGISIFFIFVCKRKILRKLKKRFRSWRDPDTGHIGRSHSSQTTTSDVSQEVPLQVCRHPDGNFKHRPFEKRFDFN